MVVLLIMIVVVIMVVVVVVINISSLSLVIVRLLHIMDTFVTPYFQQYGRSHPKVAEILRRLALHYIFEVNAPENTLLLPSHAYSLFTFFRTNLLTYLLTYLLT